MFGFQHGLAVDNNLITFYGNHFPCIFIYKVFHPRLQHTGGQLSSDSLFQAGLVDLYFFRQIENFQNILVAFKTNRPQQRRNRQFLFTVDVRIHHVVDVGCKFNPRTTERNYSGRIKFCTIGMNALSEKHPWRPVKLRYNDTFGTIDYKSPFRSHIRDGSQIDILYHRVKILMVRIRAI